MLSEYFKNKYQLSEIGSRNLVKAIGAVTAHNMAIMMSLIMVFLFFEEALKPITEGTVQQFDLITYLLLSIFFVLLVWFTARLQYNRCFLSSYKESSSIRVSLAEKFRKLPLSYFSKKDPTDLTAVMMGDVAFMESAMSHFIPELIGSFVTIGIVSIGLFVYDWRMALATLWIVPISLALILLSRKLIAKLNSNMIKSKLADQDSIQECLETITEIRGCGREEYFEKKVSAGLKNTEKETMVGEVAMGVAINTAKIILYFGIPTVIVVGLMLLIAGKLELLPFIMFLFVVARLYDPLSVAYENLGALMITDEKVKALKIIHETPIQTGTENPVYEGMDVVFDNVSFRYGEGEQILDGVSFTAKKGEVTALIGPSGSGKSTALKLAARFWDIQGGKITLGGQDISKVDPEVLLMEYSVVFQDVVLFSGSVMDNIRIGKHKATDEEVLEAARLARCDEFVNELSDGYNTDIGENGSKLSGGERQRISIARAILKNAPVVILDEATASLDSDNETHIQAALSELTADKTVLIIAHRMRTITNADRVIVLNKGKVVQDGVPRELLQQEGPFREMTEIQGQNISLIV